MAFRDTLKKYRESQGTQTTQTTTSPAQQKSTPGASGSGSSSSKFSDWLKEYREVAPTISLEKWAESSVNLIDDVRNNSDRWYDDNEYQSRSNRFTSLLGNADKWRKQYAGNSEAISYIDSVVSALSEAKSYTYSYRKYYSQWDTEDAYKKAVQYSTPEGRQEQYEKNQKRLEELKMQRKALHNQPGMNPYLTGAGPNTMPLYGSPYAAAQQDTKTVATDIEKEIAAIEAEMEMYERGNTDESGFYYGSKVVDDYSKVMSDPNYGRFSGFRSYSNPSRETMQEYDALSDPSGWYRDANGDLYDSRGIKIDETPDANGNIKSPLDDQAKYTVNDPLGMYLSTSEDERNAALSLADGMDGSWEAHIRDGYYGNWEQLTEGEVGIYYTLLGTKGKDAAMQYLTDMTTELNRRNMIADTKRYNQEFDEAGTLERIGMSLATVPAQLLGGATGFLDDLGHTLRGEDINPYSAAHTMSNYANVTRSNQAQALDEATKGVAIPFIDFTVGDLYQAGMSAVDMGVGGLLGGTAYGALMGMGAASSEARRLYEMGASNAQIAWGAALAGGAEMVFEKYSIENLINLKDADTVGRLVMNALIQGGVEASEEGFTELANTITNAIVMGSESDWAKLLEENDGVTWKALAAKAQEIGSAAFSGFVSGGFGGSGASVRSYAGIRNQNIQTGKTISESNSVDPLRNLALDMAKAEGNENAKELTKQAERLGKKFHFDSNKNAAVGRLYNTVRSSVTEQNISEISSALQEKGISKKDASAIAEAVAAQANGIELSDKQQKVLDKFGSDEKVKAVLDDTLNNAESGINQRAKNVAKFEFGVMRNHIISQMEQSQAAQEKTSASDKVDAQKENGSEVHYEASVDGKTKVDGKEVQVTGIRKTENGSYAVAIGDNESTDGSNVKYASKGQALVFESYTNLDSITDSATVRNMNAEARSSIAMAYDPASEQDGKKYVLGANVVFYYGYKGLSVKSLVDNVFVKEMTAEQVTNAYNEGRKQAQADLATKKKGMDAAYQQAKEVIKNKTDAAKNNGGNHAILEEGISEKTMTKQQRASYKLAEAVANSVGTDVHVYLGGTEQGKYEGTTGEIWLNINANHSGQSMMAFTLGHELVHMAKQWSEDKYQAFVDFLLGAYGEKGVPIELLIKNKIDSYKEKGETLTRDAALEEVICDSCQRMLLDTNAVQEMAEFKKEHPDIVQAIMDFVKEWLDKIREAFKGVEPGSMEAEYFSQLDHGAQEIAKNLFVDMVMDAGDRMSTIREAYGKGTVVAVNENGEYSLVRFDENTDVVDVTEFTKHSYSSLAEAAGFAAVEYDDGTRAFTRNGEKVTEVTVEDIENSPIGAFINFSLEQKDISKADADRQKKMFADICTMACKTNDFAMTMQFVGSAVFTGMKANADKQYGTTYDFPSICTKTQAVIDVMSAKMVKLGRGLNTDEITEIYREVFASGNPVPCPECYVFSRWIGIGGLLDNIKKYQDYYGSMTVSEAADAYRKMRAEIEQFANEQELTFGKAKGALTSKLTKEFNKLTEKIEKATNQGESVKDSDRKRLEDLEPMMNTVKAMTWLENVYFADSSLTKVNKNFRVPNEVLFDLNNGEVFAAQYKDAWAFRTTQGAGYGKAITPYAEARLGEGILVTNNTTNTIKGKAQGSLNNYFLKQNGKMDAKAKEALMRARLKQKNQAFIGGQRFQSTSDARYENASDYLLAALEMQAMHGMVQVYTKVDGAVPAFSAWNMSINQSLMPLGGGLDADGNVKDTSVGGMNPKVAFANRDKHETAGTITIGVNDNHIRAMFKQWVRDFIIPYHASGGKADVVADFRSIQEGQEKRGKMVRSTDYSRTQSDKVLSDDVLRWQGKTQEEIDRIHALREARIGILTRGKVNMDVVRSNEFLSALFDKLHGGEWDGVKLAKSKVESQIYPNEFWNQKVSYDDSAQITEDYLQYCDDLGFLHRFSGLVPRNGVLVPVTGYDQNGERVQLTDLAYKYDENGKKTGRIEEFFWKVLTDRRMYDNDGKYLPQKVVTLNDTTTDTVTEFAQNNSGRQYDKQKAIELAKKIADVKFSFGVTQKDIDDYVDAAFENRNSADYKKYATASAELVEDVKQEVNIAGYAHALRDNDIRHIRNSHGEGTNEKYPVTRQDIKNIPMIVENYDKVYVLKRKNGRVGVLYVKVDSNGLVYYLEQVTTMYGNEPLLVNKQMIKTGIGDIPDIAGLYDAITKKQSETEFLNDLKQIQQVYAQSVYQSHSTNTVPHQDTGVNTESGKIDDRNSRPSSNGISSRQLLADAFDELVQTPKERELMDKYRANIAKVEEVQERLRKLRGMISKLTNANGDKAEINALNQTAAKLADLIDKYDRKLLELEASKPLRDVVARAKSAAYQAAKKNHEEVMKEYRKQVSERFDRGVESRRRTAMRHKIKDVVNELNQYLLKGTKERHVPIGLQKAVAEALNAVNMDTVGAEARIAKLQAELMKARTPDEIQEISKKIEHIREMGDKLDEKLNRLKTAYDEFINSDDPLIANAHDDAVSAHMMKLIVRVGDTPLREMTLDQLQDVYDVYKVVLASIRNANKSFKDNKNREISTRANQVMAEIDGLGVKRGKRPVFMNWIEKFGWDGLKPVYAMEHIGSQGLIDAYNNVRAGEDTWAKDIVEAREFYLEKFKKYGYDSWDFEKKYKFTSTTGKDFELTLDQIMSLYAYSKRDQAEDHLKYGGIVFDPKTEVVEKTKSGIKVKYNVANATAYNISADTLTEIISILKDEQTDFVDEMQAYLSDVMGAKGNEVSLAMYDVKLFRDKNYFPLKSAHQYMAKAKEQAQGEVKIKNSGFSKETKPHAKNPIVLSSFMDVWSSHVNEMSMYHAFVLPMEDFYRIYNYTTPSKDETLPTEGVNPSIENAYGIAATEYIEQMLKDLNGGARADSRTGFINKMTNLFKKGAVFASLSVVVQQPSAIARAVAIVDTKYFIGPKVDQKRHKALWEEVKQYAPVAIIKEMGYFDTNMGKSTQDFIMGQEYSGFSEKMKALVNDSNYRDEVLSKAPALADEIAWCGIWEAVKRETKDANPGMDVTSDEFLKNVGERFTEVIVKTQVYDSVLSRSAMMRSKDTGLKMATAFMAEPTTSINMVADALLKGKRNGVDGRRYCRKAIGAVIAAQILNAILVSFVYAGRDDDEEETYVEKYIGTLSGEIMDGLNPAGYIPFIKDIMSIVQGYDVERSDMAVVSDLWKAWQNLSKDDMSVYRKVEGFAGSIAQIFGLPVKNIMRDARGIYQTVMSFVNSQEKTTKAGIGYAIQGAITGKTATDKEQLYEARMSGDEAHTSRLEDRYGDTDSADSAVRAAIKDSFMDDEIDEATALKHMVLYAGMDGSEAHWLMDEWKYRKAVGSEDGYSKYGRFYDAVRTGTDLKATVKSYTDNGVKPSTLAGQITEEFKPEYVKMSASERASMKGYLVNAYTLCGVEREDAMERIAAWDWEAQGVPGATADAIQDYTEWCEPVGISKSVYMAFRKFANDTKNDVDENGNTINYSAVKKIMAYIDSLDLTDAQKNALAKSKGWKDSTIKKYKTW